MEPAEWLTILAEVLRARGYSVPIVDGAVQLVSLGLTARPLAIEVTSDEQLVVVRAVLETAGMRINALGFAPDRRAAAVAAAEQWIQGVFPVLHAWKCRVEHEGHATLGTKTCRLLALDHATDHRSAWLVHLGPLLHTKIGPGRPMSFPDLLAFPARAFGALRILGTMERTPVWIEASASRTPTGGHGLLRVHDLDWLEDAAELKAWAQEWPLSYGHLSSKQFMLMERTEYMGLSAGLQVAFEEAIEGSNAQIRAEGGDTQGWRTAILWSTS